MSASHQHSRRKHTRRLTDVVVETLQDARELSVILHHDPDGGADTAIHEFYSCQLMLLAFERTERKNSARHGGVKYRQ
jgi:hypothetical protein